MIWRSEELFLKLPVSFKKKFKKNDYNNGSPMMW